MQDSLKNLRVLAIDPFGNGYGFAVLEGPQELIDWGTKDIFRKAVPGKVTLNSVSIASIEELIETYRPDCIVIENCKGERSYRRPRVRRLIKRVQYLAEKNGLKVYAYSPADIRKTFEQFEAANKHQISNKIAEWFPELFRHLPKFRKPWMPEDSRMSIFDAVALATTFYSEQTKAESVQSADEEIAA